MRLQSMALRIQERLSLWRRPGSSGEVRHERSEVVAHQDSNLGPRDYEAGPYLLGTIEISHLRRLLNHKT